MMTVRLYRIRDANSEVPQWWEGASKTEPVRWTTDPLPAISVLSVAEAESLRRVLFNTTGVWHTIDPTGPGLEKLDTNACKGGHRLVQIKAATTRTPNRWICVDCGSFHDGK